MPGFIALFHESIVFLQLPHTAVQLEQYANKLDQGNQNYLLVLITLD